MKELAQKKIAFIGAGNMAEALVQGLVHSKACPPSQIIVTDVREDRVNYFQAAFAVNGSSDNCSAVSGSDIVVLAVKPQVMAEVLDGIREAVTDETLIISIAAGLKRQTILETMGGAVRVVRVVRVMPNTPALVGAGISAITADGDISEDDIAIAEALMNSVGEVVRVAEKDMDAVTAVSGSGPAYVFLLMEAMQTAAKDLGLAPEVAARLVTATVRGAARLASESDEPPVVLRERVTSKGGTTEAALSYLVGQGVPEIWVEAIRAAHRRSVELSGGV